VNYVSVCSGIEAATVAWHSLGWNPLLFAEVAPFPSAVLAHRYPKVRNVGDLTLVPTVPNCHLLVGGTPCQDFSVAGLRAGLSGARGNLALEFFRLADRLRPRWILWENVPGVLSSNGGRDFGAILGALGYLGYGFAYRVLDAQFFGVPQRRRRVFVVGSLGGWRRAAAVLFERESLRRNTPKGRKTGSEIAGTLGGGSQARGWNDDLDRSGAFVPTSVERRTDPVEGAFQCGGGNVGPMGTLRAGDSHTTGVPFVRSVALRGRDGGATAELGDDKANALRSAAGGGSAPYVFTGPDVAHALTSEGHDASEDGTGGLVRRLTPRECERLQGFPDDYTLIPVYPSLRKSKKKVDADVVKYFVRAGLSVAEAEAAARHPDGPRYAALGNSMAVPVMRWIGERIAFVDSLPETP
jgi:DNA (cytosine-5)-methyltransferase 1